MGTLVLVHGFPLSARMWEPQLELCSQGWRVIAPHLRGFGGPPASSAATSMDEFAADIVDLLDALHVDRPVIAGLSMGGYIAFALLRRAPHYVRALVLADTRAEADPPAGLEARTKLLAEVQARGAAAAADEMLPKLVCERTRTHRRDVVDLLREMILGTPPATIAAAIRAMMTRTDCVPLLPAIGCPTLVVVGDQDAITPIAFSQRMQRLIPGAEIEVIPDAGHMANMEQPAAFNRALGSFLERRT